MAIGPDGKFPYGKPINNDDKGGVYVGIRHITVEGRLLFVMEFGTELSWLASSVEEGRQQAKLFREMVKKRCGNLPYSAKSFPFKVVANKEKSVIETTFTHTTPAIVANPEFWLGWAEHIERCIKTLTN